MPSDLEELFAIQGDPVAMRFTSCAPTRAAPWTAVLAGDGRVVGWGGLNRDPEAPEWGVEVAYYLSPSLWGRGLATELVRESVLHAFGDLALPEVSAFVRPENVASVRVLVKNGFERRRFVPQLERDEYLITADAASARPRRGGGG